MSADDAATPDDTALSEGHREAFLDVYETRSPRAQHQLDLFADQWTSKVPILGEETISGPRDDLFHDQRIQWGLEALGPITGMTVLELGPLEGAHTTLLEERGAGQVVAVEAHRQAFLRCLVVKNLLGLRAHFELGDFVGHLREHETTWDLCVATGVLYHLHDPLELIALLGQRARRVLLWTHYWDDDVMARRPDVAERFDEVEPVQRHGLSATYHRYGYGTGVNDPTFCGGSRTHARWMERNDILDGLAAVGFERIDTGFDDPFWPHGPALCVAAARPDAVSRHPQPRTRARRWREGQRGPEVEAPWKQAARRLTWLTRRRGSPTRPPEPPAAP
ncbi:MAG: class I SAM-dependent methyltransferase [Actinobacteria bacterium QS_5_72_10]|nr:MAG: class I SAM-dependent methyltransferase [Actinobacteria bacterium QS_5_72_10]